MERLELTGIIKKEGRQYSALCLELDVASCGDMQEEAKALRDAVETYVQYMVEEEREDEIYHPVPLEALREFLTDVETKPIQTVLELVQTVQQLGGKHVHECVDYTLL